MDPIWVGYASFSGFNEYARQRHGADVQVWYTERNGDGIGCVMPADAKPEDLPPMAMGYMVFEWIDPDKDFGTGIKTKFGRA